MRTLLMWTWVMASVIAASIMFNAEVLAAEKDDVYISLYALRSWPTNRDVSVRGNSATGTSIEDGFGAGIKVGIYPDVTRRIVGIELESYGHGSDIAFTFVSGNGGHTGGTTGLIVTNSMVNILLRYPDHAIQPYVGVGVGVSQGYVTGADIPGRADRDFESATAFGYQFVAGLQAGISERVFAFGEYKWFAANYHWAGLSLDLRAQYAVLGIGMRF